MGNEIIRDITSVLLAIVGLGIIATILSKRAATSQVISAGGAAFSGAIATAQGPVTGFMLAQPSTSLSAAAMPEIGAGYLNGYANA